MTRARVGSRVDSGRGPRAGPSAAQRNTSRRYEAVVLVGEEVVGSRGMAEDIAGLCASGASVAVIATSPLALLATRLSSVRGPGVILLAGESGSQRAMVGTDGVVDLPTSFTERDKRSDEGDALRWIMDALWAGGVGPRSTLLVVDGQRGFDGLDRLMIPEVTGVTLGVGGGTDGLSVPVAVVMLGGRASGADLLAEQLRCRRRHEVPRVVPEPGWGLVIDGVDHEHQRVNEALLTLADGRIGTGGAPLVGHPATRRWVMSIGMYAGRGAATHLLEAPMVSLLAFPLLAELGLRRVLDLRTGILGEVANTTADELVSARFASLARPGLLAARVSSSASDVARPSLEPPVDGHALDHGIQGDVGWMRVADGPGGISAALRAVDARARDADGHHVIEWFAAYDADPDVVPDPDRAIAQTEAAATDGFDRLLAEHRRAWADRWNDIDIRIDGDEELQLATRFGLFHLMGSVPDSGEAAVGARGLTGPDYRGHVFWDADTFVLPCLAATHPAAARAMLEYRIKRLPAALDAARENHRSGARFPWESARSGRDVTPRSARDRTGKTVRIRTGQLEEHIVADVAWAACHYGDWTGDEEFMRGPGLRLLVDTARYWSSRVQVEPDGTAHINGVIGPDEYHEAVDDNAFTNVMARWNLRRAAEDVEIAAQAGSVSVPAPEAARWRELADAIVDGYDADTGVYEQFAGFSGLDPLIIAEAAPRRPIAAGLLLGAERVRASQVVKQADVLMLHHLLPEEVVPGSLVPNLDFYEPRTAHGSSLSPGVHASLFARADDLSHALEALRTASRMDLDDLTGTTAGGLHLATIGSLWQALVFGFAGIRPVAGRLQVDPHLPQEWRSLEVNVLFRGSRVRMRTQRGQLSIQADVAVPVSVGSAPYTAGQPGLQFRRRGPQWRLT